MLLTNVAKIDIDITQVGILLFPSVNEEDDLFFL
jgi:hypothetical protein